MLPLQQMLHKHGDRALELVELLIAHVRQLLRHIERINLVEASSTQ